MPKAKDNLIPKNKHDLQAVQNLQGAEYASIIPILDQLLDWTADGNWPVAKPLASFLATLGDPIAPAMRKLLNGDDTIHKYWCLLMIVPQLRPEILSYLVPDLERLADNASIEEAAEDVSQLASKIIRQRG